MPLLVVPLAPDETELLTLREWEALLAHRQVFFEQPEHPLADRLASAGVEVAALGNGLDADAGAAVVLAPGSPRVLELARGGAEVTAAVAASPDGLTAAHAAPSLRRAASALGGITAVMARLYSEDGCPWDREQTHESLRVHLLEEAYEVLEAIDRGATGEELEEELGDLLLQVAFHARLGELDGRFDLASVARRITAKLLYRHPHVFGEKVVSTAAEVVASWEEIKASEKGRADPFDGIPRTLPALLAASKTQKRAASLGFSPSRQEARERLADAVGREEVGDALFWLVAVARARGTDPEGALRESLARFRSGLAPAPRDQV